MYGISGEHLLILLVILLIFGPRRLPDLGHSIGRTMKNFKDGLSGNHEAKTATPAPVAQQIPAQPAQPKSETVATAEAVTEAEKV